MTELSRAERQKAAAAKYRASEKGKIARKRAWDKWAGKPESQEKLAGYQRKYDNSDKGRQNKARYFKERYATDQEFRIANILRARLRMALKSAHILGVRSEQAVQDLGCPVPAFREYISGKFQPGMSWDNWGAVWELDHISPLGLFNLADSYERRSAVHFTNFQPLFLADHKVKSTADRLRIRAHKKRVQTDE